jgi:hypothetical protein
MVIPLFMAAAICAGLFLMLGINPFRKAKRLFARKHRPTFREYLLAARGLQKRNFIEKQFARTEAVLQMTGRGEQAGKYMLLSILLAVVGAGVGILLINPLLAIILALLGLLIPQFAVQMTAFRYQKESREELFTALSIVTSSYERVGNLIWAVEENIGHIHPPVEEVFTEFLRQCRMVDPSVPRALSVVREKLDNDIWREWCDDMQLCVANPSERRILRGIVEKCGRQNRAQNELDALLSRPIQQMLTVMAISLINVPLVCFMFSDFGTVLFHTIQGKCGLAVVAAAVLFAVYKAVHAARPIEYRKAVAKG